MQHTKRDFINVCNEVLAKQDLNEVERIHSFSFWMDLRSYLEDSSVKKREQMEEFKKLFEGMEF